MAFNLQKVLKALLFSSSEPLSVKDIQAAFDNFHARQPKPAAEETPDTPTGADTDDKLPPSGENPPEAETETPEPLSEKDAELYQDVPALVTATQIREAMDALATELREADDTYLLLEGAAGYRLVTHPRYARWIRILRNEPPPVRLTQSALETLAIVAYRQPTTRTEIESIRGVSAEAGLNRLLERELITITGRADLPGRPLQYGTTEKFLEYVGVKSIVELPSSDVLTPRQIDAWLQDNTNATPPADAEMGLPLEDAEGASPMQETVQLESAPEENPDPVNDNNDDGTPPPQS